jgi:hypothetical protein
MAMPDPDGPATVLAGWREAERNATPGPWRVKAGHLGGHPKYVTGPDNSTVAECWMDDDGSAAGFIVTARTAMPLLLAAADKVLELAGEWEDAWAARPLVTRGYAAECFRAAIMAALTGEEANDARNPR